MTRKQRRLVLISCGLAVIGLAVGLVLFALRDNIVFFYGPSELAQKAPSPERGCASAVSSSRARFSAKAMRASASPSPI